MSDYVQGCYEADYDPQTATCTSLYLIPQESSFPALTIADAQEIGLACALLWASAWSIRRIARLLDQL